MFCRFCGKQLQSDSRFCQYCGKEVYIEPASESEPVVTPAPAPEPEPVVTSVPAPEPEPVVTSAPPPQPVAQPKPKQKGSNKKWFIILGAVAALLIILVAGYFIWDHFHYDEPREQPAWLQEFRGNSFNGGNSNDSGSTGGNSGNGWFFGGGDAFTKDSKVTGKKISASAGEATLVVKKEFMADEYLILPDFAAWSQSEFTGSSTNGTYAAYSMNSKKTPEIELAEQYLEFLEDTYGYTVNNTLYQDPNWIGEYKYHWTVSKNGYSMNVSLEGITGGYGEYFILNGDAPFAIVDTGERANGRKESSVMDALGDSTETYTLTPKYSALSKAYSILLTGWETEKGLGFSLSPSYTEGTTLSYWDFSNNSNVSSAENTCYCEYVDNTANYYLSTHATYIKAFTMIDVEVLDSANGYQAIYFYVVMVGNDFYRYTFEGICAPGEGEKAPELNTNNNSSGGGSYGGSTGGNIGTTPNIQVSCAMCNGSGWQPCYSCGKDGWIFCTLCNGSGTYRAYGQSHDCSCLNGEKKCGSCNGRGEVSCSACGGDGIF